MPIYAVYTANPALPPADHSSEDLEWFRTVDLARDELKRRRRTGRGTFKPVAGFAHACHWPDSTEHAVFDVWVCPAGERPDTASLPHERWETGPRGGVVRSRY